MSKILELPDPVYDALEDAASASGLSPAGWIAANLPDRADDGLPERVATTPRSMADLFAGRIGRFASGNPSCLSEASGDLFAEEMARKRADGTL